MIPANEPLKFYEKIMKSIIPKITTPCGSSETETDALRLSKNSFITVPELFTCFILLKYIYPGQTMTFIK
jgi:hypothetical protein